MEFSLNSPDFVTKSFHQKILDHSSVAIAIVYGPEFIIKMVNELNLQLWQRTYGEVIDKPLFKAFPETASQQFKDLLTRVYETGESYEARQVPAQLFRNNVYETIWVDIKYEPLRDDAGEIKAILVMSTDVTNEVLLQKKVAEVNDRIEKDSFTRHVLESSPDCLKILDSEGRIQFINKNGLALLRIKNKEDVQLKYWWQLWPLNQKQTILNALRQVKETGSAEFIASANAPDNTPMVWDIKLSLVESQENGVQIISVSRDLTQHSATNEILKKTTERLNGGLRLASIALAEINYTTNMAQLSPEAAKMYGFPKGTEWVSREALHNTFHPDYRPKMEVLIKKSLDPAGDGLIAVEHPVVHTGGIVRWLKVNKQVYFDRSVQPAIPMYSILAVKDITVQKNKDRQLEESEAKYRNLFEKVNQGFCIIELIFNDAGDPIDYRFLECNNAFEQQTGLVNAMGKTVKQVMPVIEQKWIKFYGEVATTGIAAHITEYAAAMSKWYEVHAYRHNAFNHAQVAVLFTDITDKKTYEQIILQSEQRFRDIFTNAAVGIAVTRVDGTFIHVNQACLNIVGCTAPEMELQTIYKFLHPADVSTITSNIHQLLSGDKQGIVSEARFINKNGKHVWTQLSISVLEDENGLPLNIISLIEDITEKKLAADKLLSSEKKFRNIFESSSVSIWVEDFSAIKKMIDKLKSDGVSDFVSYSKEHPVITKEFVEKLKVIDVNDYSLSMFEANSKQELIKGLKHIFLSDTVAEFGSEMQAIAENKRYFEAERITKTLKGRILHLLVSISFPVGTDYSTVLVSVIDISKRKQAEATVRESESRFRTLAETLPQLVWMADESGENSYRSTQWLQYTGISDPSDEQFWNEIVHPDDRKKLEETWQQAVVEKRPFKELARLKHHTGIFRWNECAGYPIFSGGNYLAQWIGIVNDIHDLKIQEQIKDDFIGIASHEMRTPLTSVKGYLQILVQSLGATDTSASLFATKALSSANRLEAMTNELLDATRIQHGQLKLDISTFNFNGLVNETIEIIQADTSKHMIVKTGEINTLVQGDKERLQQVLINLISNAIKYSPDAEKVEVNLENTKDSIVVSVKDYGIGLDKTHLKKIFERYYRVQENANRFKGLGIGLFISYNIILAHHGSMWVESEPGTGSTFYFSIPL